MCRSRPTFFGRGPTDRETILEWSFLLAYYLGVTLTDFWKMPLSDVKWYIQRLNRELNPEKEQVDDPKPMMGNWAPKSGDPTDRAMTGMQRAFTPARLRRFS